MLEIKHFLLNIKHLFVPAHSPGKRELVKFKRYLFCFVDEKFSDDIGGKTRWYIIVVALMSGFIAGVLLTYIVWCSHRHWFRKRKPKRNPDQQPNEADSTYQELDLSKMNQEDNYQSLGGNVARINDIANNDESTYTELSKTRDVEDNYQSLT